MVAPISARNQSSLIRRFRLLGFQHFKRAGHQRIDTVFNIDLLVE
jgi:hypothetical protein